jgi:putative FmdB family regulatory protein
MPLYEYECLKCGKRSETLQRLDDPPLTTCEECGGELKKLMSAPAFQFKGSGWYVTDYAGKKGGAGKGEEGKGASSSGDSEKPAAKSTEPAKSSTPASTSKTTD